MIRLWRSSTEEAFSSAPAETVPSGKREQAAQKTLDAQQERLAKWLAAAEDKRARLQSLEQRVGDEVLAAPDDQADALAVRLAGEVTALRDAIEVDRRAAVACEPKVAAAERAVVVAQIEDLREQSAALTAEADQHEITTKKLLAQLKKHEGVDYAPWKMPRVEVDRLFREGAKSVYAGDDPRSEKLRQRAARLERTAAELEAAIRVPTAAPTATLNVLMEQNVTDHRIVRGAPLLALVSASFYVSAGEGGPFEYELLVDDAVVERVRVEAGSVSEKVRHPLGLYGGDSPSLVGRRAQVRVGDRVLAELEVAEFLLQTAAQRAPDFSSL